MSILQNISIDNVLNNAMTSFLFPLLASLVIFLANCIKKWRDEKRKNKSFNYWRVNYRIRRPFWEVSIGFMMGAMSLFLPFAYLFERWNGIFFNCFFEMLYLVIYIIFVKIFMKTTEARLELLKFKKTKIFMLFILGPILSVPMIFLKNRTDFLLYYLTFVFTWMMLVYRYSDKIIIYDMRFANIYIRGEEPIKNVPVHRIKKRGSWIKIEKYGKYGYQEILIRENQLEHIEYFGDPFMIVEGEFIE